MSLQLPVSDLLPDVDMRVPVVLSGELVLLPYDPPMPAADAYDPEQDPLFGGGG